MTQHDKEYYRDVTNKVVEALSLHQNVLSKDLNALIRKIGAHFRDRKDDRISDYIDEFVALIIAALSLRIRESVRMATETEDDPIPIEEMMLRSRFFSEEAYGDSVEKMRKIFTKEIEYFVALDMPYSAITAYMGNPTGFLASHKQDIGAFKRYVNVGTGYTYKIKSNIFTILGFASMVAYDLALTELWGYRGDVIGYRGYRNSSFDCSACDDACSVVHPLDTYVFPVHVRCCCIVTPVFIQ